MGAVAALGAARFSPLTLPGLVAVYDAYHNASASQWDDSSGNGNHATQGTAALQPAYFADDGDGAPALRFDGADDHYVILTLQAVVQIVSSGVDPELSVKLQGSATGHNWADIETIFRGRSEKHFRIALQ